MRIVAINKLKDRLQRIRIYRKLIDSRQPASIRDFSFFIKHSLRLCDYFWAQKCKSVNCFFCILFRNIQVNKNCGIGGSLMRPAGGLGSLSAGGGGYSSAYQYLQAIHFREASVENSLNICLEKYRSMFICSIAQFRFGNYKPKNI